MIDTLNLELTQAEVTGMGNFLCEIPQYLNPDSLSLHNYQGEEYFTGSLDNLKVEVRGWRVRVGYGSLCKYLLGDNFKRMGRADIERAIEKISDSLHLPMSRAEVKRLDIADNFCVRQPPEAYYNHLGVLAHFDRLPQQEGLYYRSKRGQTLCFYDKVREQRKKGEPIPELYQRANVLRYEQRYLRRLGEAFQMAEVRACNLYAERFYIDLLNRWRDGYRAIRKINEITPNFQYMKNVSDFNLLGRLAYIEQRGGEVAMMEQIAEAQKRGDLSNIQAMRLRNEVKNTCKVRENLTAPSEAITELDKKVAEAVRFYR